MTQIMLCRRSLSLVGLLLAAGGATYLVAGEDATAPATPVAERSQIRREGTPLDEEPGRFVTSGNRLVFMSSSGAAYISLENLNLERVGKIVSASVDPIDWFITGTVTEYQGANYLLISRARRQAAPPKHPRGF